MIRQLVQVTFREAEEKQLDLVCENLDLLFRMGFRHELKRCYAYAQKSLQSPEIMDEIDFTLMRTAVRSNKLTFFYMDCPLSLESLLKWWDEMIDERFDEAIVLWKEGRKDEAKRIRKELYTLFSQSMFYRLRDFDIAGEEMPERQKYDLIWLMGRFVERRTDTVGSLDADLEPIELGKDWRRSERELLDDEYLEMDAENLAAFASETVADWEAGRCSEEIREMFEGWPATPYAAKTF